MVEARKSVAGDHRVECCKICRGVPRGSRLVDGSQSWSFLSGFTFHP